MDDYTDYDDDISDLRLDRQHARRMRNLWVAHPDPRDPDFPYDDEGDDDE